MEDADSANTDALLQELGGCGRFQTILVIIVNLLAIPGIMGYLTDSFGMYNPGWRCLDNATMSDKATSFHDNTTLSFATAQYTMTAEENNKSETELSEFGKHSCDLYASCTNVEFRSDVNTYVNEWSLICDRGWILSTVISIRMAGNLVSTLVAGYVGDRYGRKIPMIVGYILQLVVLNLISIFSVSWQMYAVVSFFMGCLGPFGMLASVIAFEYVTPSWRVKVGSLPTWSLVSILFAAVAMVTEDWRYLRLVTTVMGAVCAIPLFWIPKSIRWLTVQKKDKDVLQLVRKIGKINKSEMSENDPCLDSFIRKNQDDVAKTKTYTIIQLFRRKGYRIPTVVVGLICLTLDMVYFAMSFGVISLPGNLYTNMMISSATELPANIISFLVANLFRRKPSTLALFMLTCVCLFGVVAIDLTASGDVKQLGTVILVMLAKLILYVGWIIFSTSISELYPTVVRSTVKSYMFFASAIGGIIAPFLIPTDPSTFYICYLSMAIVFMICSAMIVFIPETKGRPLKDDWDEDVVGGEGQEMTAM